MSQIAEDAGHTNARRRKILLALIVLLAMLIVALVCWGAVIEFLCIPFEREGWAAYRPFENDHTRKWMYSDLSKRHLKPGMNRDEVLRLLGKPESQGADYFHYDFGPDSFPLPVDRTILYIYFDKSGRVTDFGIGQS
jgi:hypothetical protein